MKKKPAVSDESAGQHHQAESLANPDKNQMDTLPAGGGWQQANLLALIENTESRIWSVDAHYCLIIGNSAFHQEIQAVRGSKFTAGECVLDPHFSPDAIAEWQQYYDRALGGEKFSVETRGNFPREQRWMDYRFNPIRDNSGKVTGVAVSGRDISARKQAEEMLRQSEFLLNRSQEQAGLGSFIWDLRDDSLNWSRNMFAIHGVDPENFNGSLGEVSSQLIHPDDRERVRSEIAKMVAARRVWKMEFRIIRPDGVERVMQSAGEFEVDPQGRPVKCIGIHQDITELKRAEQSLKESGEIFQQIVERSNDVFYRQKINSARFEYVSPKVTELLGYSPEEFLARDLEDQMETIHPDDLPFLMNFKDELIAADNRGENHIERDFRVKTRQGEYRWMHGNYTLVRNEEDDPLMVVGSLSDITERILTEEALRKSEAFLKSVVDNIPLMVFVKDAEDLRFVTVNIAEENLLGWKSDEVIGKNDHDLFSKEAADAYTAKDRETLQKRQLVDIPEETIQTRDFGERILHTKKIPLLDSEGVPQYLLGISEDITERKRAEDNLRESEARFKAVSEYSHNAICLINEAGGIIWVNEAFIELGGYSREQIYKAASFADFLAPESVEFVISNFTKFVMNQPYEHHYSFYIIRSDGQKRLCEKHMTDYEGQFGKRILAISMVDITERVQAEKDKEKLQEQFLQAQKMESVGRLAGGVAHDFNNWLGVILGHAEKGMAKVTPDQAVYHDLQEIQKAGQRSAALTRQLLAFARKQTVSPRVLDVNATIASLFDMFRRLIGENIDLVWAPDPDLWHVRMDPSQVDQVLANLLVNARDAIGGAGKVVIETSNAAVDEAACLARPGLTPGEYALLSVRDSGSGMDSETLAHLFEPFYTTKEIGKGTGLGLATIYGIVKQNNGFVEVSSEPGQGTTFRVYLPRVEEQTSPIATPIANAMEKPQGGAELVLIVEDEEALLEMGKDTLEELGYIVLAASRPDDALRLAQEHAGKIELLITDVVMPGMNGRVLAEKLIAIQPGLKCLFMSGYTADIITDHEVLPEGIYFIQKPFSLNELASRVRQALEKK